MEPSRQQHAEPESDQEKRKPIPLCVDLDGTLIRTDLLFESVFVLLRRNLLYILLIPIWLVRGKANLKEQVARRVELPVHLLPYHGRLLEYLREEHRRRRPLVLVTAANRRFAESIARYLGLFSSVLASDARVNLSEARKLACLRDLYGEKNFDYAGNSRADLKVWANAHKGIIVSPEVGVTLMARRVVEVERVFDGHPGRPRAYLRAMRVQQWLKNLLVFVPMVFAHQMDDTALLLKAALAFVSFSLCAASAYLLNDLLDLSADRKHPRKRQRPFAAGSISVKVGTLLIPALLTVSLVVAAALSWEFLQMLLGYYLATLAYSFWLKSKMVADILLLAGLYTLRVIAGATATQIVLSFWLLAFSMFIFLSLAVIKRYSELLVMQESRQLSLMGRDYTTVDMQTLTGLGTASGYMSVLVLALYIDSPQVVANYAHPQVLWLLCPLLLYWISRAWLLAGRGQMHDDPLVFAIKDRVSWLTGVCMAIVLWGARS